MAFRDDARAAITLLDHFEGKANGRRAVDVVRDLASRPSLPGGLAPVIAALADVYDARDAEHEAYEQRVAAEVRLAEVVCVDRRDKDTGFDAEFEATRQIVAKAIESVRNPLVDPPARKEAPDER